MLKKKNDIFNINTSNPRIGLVVSLLLSELVLILIYNINTLIFRFCLIIISLIFLLIIYLILDYFNVERSVIFIIITGTIIRIFYLMHTSYLDRSYDVEGHLDYIKYLFNHNLNIPSVNECWECYQPPLYYLFSTLFYALFNNSQISPIIVLQILSIFVSIVVIIVAYYLFKILFKKNLKLILLSLSLFTFWSGNIIFSIRITNDTFFYLFTSLSILYLLKWIINPDKNHVLYIAAIFATLDTISKANGIIIWGVIGFLIIIKLLKNKGNFKLIHKFIYLPTLFIVSILITFYNPIFNPSNDWLIGNINTLNRALRVNNTLLNFIVLDTNTYFSQANVSSWLDSSGRQYFMNYLFKTSLFGEFIYSDNQKDLMIILSTLLLVIISIFIIGFFIYLIRARNIKEYNFFTLIFISLFVSIVMLRLKYAYSSDYDFRFILPILIPCIAFIGYLLNEFEKRKMNLLLLLGYIFNILFITLNIIFILRIS